MFLLGKAIFFNSTEILGPEGCCLGYIRVGMYVLGAAIAPSNCKS